MVDAENQIKEEFFKLENHLKLINQQNKKMLKDKENVVSTTDYLRKLITSRQIELMAKTKELAIITSKNKENKEETLAVNSNYTNEEIITKLCIKIFTSYYESLDVKLASDVNAIVNLGKNTKINYIVFKKLEIRDDWLLEKKIEINPEFFDNLKSLAKAGRLNYHSFKSCGSIILFRVLEDTLFIDLKRKACEFWNISTEIYKIYDEGFNNMDLVMNMRLNDYYTNYVPLDETLKPGYLVLYLIEKIKYQTSFLDGQLAIIDANVNNNKEDEDIGNVNRHGEHFLQCIEYVKSGKILKGIHKYKAHKYERKDKIEYAIKMVDNYHIFMLLTLAFIILSIYSLANKKNIQSFQHAFIFNRNIFQGYLYKNTDMIYNQNNVLNFRYNFTEVRDYLYFYTSIFNETLTSKKKSFYNVIGPIRIRFFRLNFIFPCPDGFEIYPQTNDTESKNICYEYSHEGDYRNKSGVYVYQFSENINVTYNLKTKIMNYDTSGTVVQLSKFDPNVEKEIENLLYICKNYKRYLLLSLRAFEISFTYYLPNEDLFVTNLILVERDQSNLPMISMHETIPFKINIYETQSEMRLFNIDLARLLILIGICFSFIFRAIQKYRKRAKKGFFSSLFVTILTLTQLKNMLLIFSLGFFINAFSNYIKTMNLSSDIQSQSSLYYDYYTHAYNQKFSINLELLSLFFVCLYSLKYFQIFQLSNMIFVAFKKSSKEYILLVLVIIICFLGLTLFTYFIYGQFINEYQNFLDAIYMNFKIFILSEQIYTASIFLNYFKSFSIVIFFLFTFIMRYFLLNLFFPILVENYRMETENFLNTEDENEITFQEKFLMFLFPFKNKKFKTDDRKMINSKSYI